MQANSREWCGIFDRRLRSSTRRKIICALDFADFQPVLYAATVMNAFSRPWCVAGGWAIDLWLGRATRGHTGVSVAICRDGQIAHVEGIADLSQSGDIDHEAFRQVARKGFHVNLREVGNHHAVEIFDSRRNAFENDRHFGADFLSHRNDLEVDVQQAVADEILLLFAHERRVLFAIQEDGNNMRLAQRS